MRPYTKPAKSPADLVQQLKQRGLIIADFPKLTKIPHNFENFGITPQIKTENFGIWGENNLGTPKIL